ncbi:MAG: hypothetical protein ABL901_07295 [Hyphomicrobiaceae bacterium]
MTKRSWIRVAGGALALSCAWAAPGVADFRTKTSPTVVPNLTPPDLSAANNAYRLSADEIAYDCKKLTGHIQVRIRQLRSTRADTKTSGVGRTMQQMASPLFGGTSRGIDPDGDNARDLSMLKAYNGRLAAKNCPIFDLDGLLTPGNTDAPRPIAKVKPTSAPLQLKTPKPVTVPVPAVAPAVKVP